MFNEKVLDFVNSAEKDCREIFEKLEEIALFNQNKVLKAFQDVNLQLADIASSTGYGAEDRAKGKLGEIYAKAFGAEFGIVSPLIASGTHALSIALFGLLRPDDTMLSVTGKPYDTLLGVIFGEGNGSLKDFKVKYDDVELVNNDFDFDLIKEKVLKLKPKMIYIQRSRGYTSRDSLSVEKIEKLVKYVRGFDKNAIIMVDNCYGEFVETKEPTALGADLIVGSLIKNPGGGLAHSGGYIAGTKKAVEMVSYRLTCPGIGRECGASLGNNRLMYQGFFMAPQIVCNAVKTGIFCSALFEELGYEVNPASGAMRSDIITSVKLGSPEKLVEFCRGIQAGAPIDSFVIPAPWDMPGYENKVIMAAGAFVSGSSIEISADGPLKAPYTAYFQGGLTFETGKLAVMLAASNVLNIKE